MEQKDQLLLGLQDIMNNAGITAEISIGGGGGADQEESVLEIEEEIEEVEEEVEDGPTDVHQ